MKAKDALKIAMEKYKKQTKNKLNEILYPWEKVNKLAKKEKLFWLVPHIDFTKKGIYLVETLRGEFFLEQHKHNFPAISWTCGFSGVKRYAYLGDFREKNFSSNVVPC